MGSAPHLAPREKGWERSGQCRAAKEGSATAHDLVIRGGTIVDGTGAEPIHADLAIDGDTITAIGRAVGRGRREISAEGHAVMPGFIDPHTHFDAQIGWDPHLTPVFLARRHHRALRQLRRHVRPRAGPGTGSSWPE